MTIDRQELYELIWATPASQLCRRFGFSDVWLAKLCKKHGVPQPPRGYWAKKRNGKPTRRIPLPPISDEKLEKIDLSPRPAPQRQTISPVVEKQIPEEKATGAAIIVGKRLNSPHPLVDRTRRSLNSSEPDRWGVIRPRDQGCLDVVVGPESIDRSMRIMDALIKAVETRGCHVKIVGERRRQITTVEIDGESIPFRLTERVQRTLPPSDPARRRSFLDSQYVYTPSGEFRLHIDSEWGRFPLHTWTDGARKKIEDRLNEFIAGLMDTSEKIKASREQTRLAEIEKERKRKIREEAERLRREEEERIRWVEATLDSWNRRRALARMIQNARMRASRLGLRITPESQMGQWIEVAERRLATLDPLAPMLAELLHLETAQVQSADDETEMSASNQDGRNGLAKG